MMFLFFFFLVFFMVVEGQSSSSRGVDAVSCQQFGFEDHCCVEGKFNTSSQKISVISSVSSTHSCFGFNSSSTSPPLMFGTWEAGTLHVRLVTGISSGLCIENFGMPVLGYCVQQETNPWSAWWGCRCPLARKRINCSNRTFVESPAKPDCPILAPFENDYQLYSQEECQNYFSSIGI